MTYIGLTTLGLVGALELRKIATNNNLLNSGATGGDSSSLNFPDGTLPEARKPGTPRELAVLSEPLVGSSQYLIADFMMPPQWARQWSVHNMDVRSRSQLGQSIMRYNQRIHDNREPTISYSINFSEEPWLTVPLPIGATIAGRESEDRFLRRHPLTAGIYQSERKIVGVHFSVPARDPVLDPKISIKDTQHILGKDFSVFWEPIFSEEDFQKVAPELAKVVRIARERPLAEATEILTQAVKSSMPYGYTSRYRKLKPDSTAEEYFEAIMDEEKGVCGQFAFVVAECFRQAGIACVNASCLWARDVVVTSRDRHMTTVVFGVEAETGEIIPHIAEATGSGPLERSQTENILKPPEGSATLLLLALGGAAAAVYYHREKRRKGSDGVTKILDKKDSSNEIDVLDKALNGNRSTKVLHNHNLTVDSLNESWVHTTITKILEELGGCDDLTDDPDDRFELLLRAMTRLNEWLEESNHDVVDLSVKLCGIEKSSLSLTLSCWLRSIRDDASEADRWVTYVRDGLRTRKLHPHDGHVLLTGILNYLPDGARSEAAEVILEYLPIDSKWPLKNPDVAVLSFNGFAYSFGQAHVTQ